MDERESDGHRLVRHERWPQYLGGMITEVGFIVGLVLIALIMAVVARVVF